MDFEFEYPNKVTTSTTNSTTSTTTKFKSKLRLLKHELKSSSFGGNNISISQSQPTTPTLSQASKFRKSSASLSTAIPLYDTYEYEQQIDPLDQIGSPTPLTNHQPEEEMMIPPLPPTDFSFHSHQSSVFSLFNSEEEEIDEEDAEELSVQLTTSQHQRSSFASSRSSISSTNEKRQVSEKRPSIKENIGEQIVPEKDNKEERVHEEDVDKLANSILKVVNIDKDIQWGI
ncbi:hypothetical protein JA1_000205 [Spathaspora sp. JA1]|nr:hypothetical protein JA1_000205 [Spathaspora sp. JA1]